MAKGSGGTKSTSWRDKADIIEALKNSSNWDIRNGMNRYEDEKKDGTHDYSDMKNLSEKDKTFLVAYLTHSYPVINKQLRTGEVSPEVRKMVQGIDAAIDKLDTYQGTTYRSIQFNTGMLITDRKNFNKTLDYYKEAKGTVITEKQYISAGKNKSKIDRKFASKDNSIHIKIESKTGRNVSHYNNEEEEILFKRGTRFRVVGVRGNNVHLQEI